MTTPTSLPRLAELADLRVWPGVVIEDGQDDSALAVLDAASAYVRLESGDPDRWPESGSIPASIRTVTVQVAARVWRNPTCASMIATGPFSDQFAQGVVDALYLSAVDREVVARVSVRPKLWSAPTYRDPDGVGPYFDGFTGEWVPPAPYPNPASLLGGELLP